ncbi:aromatic ring-opening dioxygenase LigA [Agromyces intestinalis]|uniref:Aromatic ring-opening dioxygenase LigA n=1 Tax=Agromyces intestinalis TaxID=2592652 RepID=A0A5C1YEW8_9MICO|nr:aromatic ring-opening dioxygenase LigA [Agromyces intestinalis]QEO14666.1 aromatic ring-opening dioxygenase LigA [Agromyces intestinalis]
MTEEQFETGGTTLSRGQVNVVRLTGLAGIVGGIAMVVVAILAWISVSNQLRAEDIVIPDDAPIFAGKVVDGPIDAFIQAGVIDMHAREMADGKTYAELDREDPLRATVMNASFLRASLFTSVIAFGVALMAGGVGLLFILFGWSLRVVVPPFPKQT